MSIVKTKIKQRRLQLMLHSIIYYGFNESIISDKQFDKWAYELVELQKEYPQESKETEHYNMFKDWDGSTGFHLTPDSAMYDRARKVLDYHKYLLTK